MTDLIIVGGGFWGSAVWEAARLAGWDTLLIDDGDEEGASRAAAGYVRWEWLDGRLGAILPDWWADEYTNAGRDLLALWGAAEPFVEVVHHYKVSALSPRPGLHVVDPWAVLCRDVTARVRLISGDGDGWKVLDNQGAVHEAPRVLIAAGVWTDPLLEASGFEPLGVEALTGSGLIAKGTLDQEVFTYITRPYHHVTARRWRDGTVRVGETVSRAYPDAHLGALINDAQRYFPELRNYQPISGRRPVLPEATVKELGDGLVVATGGHRIGLALAGGIAQRVMEVLR